MMDDPKQLLKRALRYHTLYDISKLSGVSLSALTRIRDGKTVKGITIRQLKNWVEADENYRT